MPLIDTLKAALLEARKARNSATSAALSTLVGEIETLAKSGRGEMTDAVVVTVIKKFIKNIDESMKAVGPTGALVLDNMLIERALYEQFLPKQLTTEELTALINGMISEGAKDVGDVMKLLKTKHAGTYNGAEASAILKQLFSR